MNILILAIVMVDQFSSWNLRNSKLVPQVKEIQLI